MRLLPIDRVRVVPLLLAAALLPAACRVLEPDADPGLENEVTEVRVACTELDDVGRPKDIVFTGVASDLDGLGGAAAVFRPLNLRAFQPSGRSDCVTAFLDVRNGRQTDLNAFLTGESNRYEVRYDVRLDTSFSSSFLIDVQDTGSAGRPLGLAFRAEVATEMAVDGVMRIRLVRYREDEKGGSPTPDVTVVDVELPVSIVPWF